MNRTSARRTSVTWAVGLALFMGVGAATFVGVSRSRRAEADRRAFQMEVDELARAGKAGPEACEAIVRLTRAGSNPSVVSDKEFEGLLLSFERFEGRDRADVCQFVVATLLDFAGAQAIEGERLELSRGVLLQILEECRAEPAVVGVGYVVAQMLGMRDDEQVVLLAQETCGDPRLPRETVEFISRVFLAEQKPGSSPVGG